MTRRKPQNLTPPGSDSSSGSGHSPPSSSLHSNGSPSASLRKASPNRVGGVKRPSPQESPNNNAALGAGSAADSAAAAAEKAKKPRISHYKKPDSSQPHSLPDSRNAQPVVTAKSSFKMRPSPPNSTHAARPYNHGARSAVASSASLVMGALSAPPAATAASVSIPATAPAVPTTTPVARVTSSTDGPDTPNSSPDSVADNLDTTDTTVAPKFMHQYRRIDSLQQRSRYKEVFNSQYKEYRELHKAIDRVSKRFAQLEEELRQEDEGTEPWQVRRTFLLHLRSRIACSRLGWLWNAWAKEVLSVCVEKRGGGFFFFRGRK